MRNLLTILITILSLHCQAQDSVVDKKEIHSIYILFGENEFATMNTIGPYDKYSIRKEKCECPKNIDLYSYTMIDGNLVQGIRGSTSWGYTTQLELWHTNNIQVKTSIKKIDLKGRKLNLIKSKDIPYAQWDSLNEVLEKASNIILLQQDPDNVNNYLLVEVTLKPES